MILNFEKLNFSWYIRSELNAAAHFLHSEFGAFCGSVNAAQADLLVFFPQQQFVEFVSRSDQLIDQLSLCVCLCLCVRWSIRADWADHIDGLTAGGEWRLLSRLSGLELSADQARFSPRLSRETCFLCRDVGVNGAAGWPLTSSTHTHTHTVSQTEQGEQSFQTLSEKLWRGDGVTRDSTASWVTCCCCCGSIDGFIYLNLTEAKRQLSFVFCLWLTEMKWGPWTHQ